MAFVVLRILIGTAVDPTSHNLWPFEIVMAGGISSVAMVVLMIARKCRSRQKRSMTASASCSRPPSMRGFRYQDRVCLRVLRWRRSCDDGVHRRERHAPDMTDPA